MALELLLVMPILLALLLGMIEFSLLFAVRQQLTTASREGARVGALGGDQLAVEQAVRNVLGAGNLSGAQIQSILTDDLGQPLPSGSPVQVTVQIPATQAVPDLLGFIAVSFSDQVIIAQSVMRKE
jgi:Flp pilus assembly protein TadG